MSITIGIDIGGSTTKIVGLDGNEKGGELKAPLMVTADDPVASLFGAFGKFVSQNGLSLGDVKKVVITGVGASYMTNDIYGVPTVRAEEFLANGYGGLKLSGLDEAVIVSMGTGTAIVEAKAGAVTHLGGTGIGGGTVLGLARRMLRINSIVPLMELAGKGDLSQVDLMVGDITKDELPGLPPHTTASNFGKLSDLAQHEDIALGIFNMVFQSIGTTAMFAAKNSGLRNIVLIGNLTAVPTAAHVFAGLSKLYGIHFIIPKFSEFGTATGAALCG